MLVFVPGGDRHGGLGPTHDDVTKKAVCRFFDMGLASRPDRERASEAARETRHSMGPTAEEQTLFPDNAEVIPNPVERRLVSSLRGRVSTSWSCPVCRLK